MELDPSSILTDSSYTQVNSHGHLGFNPLEGCEDGTDFLYNGCFDPDLNVFRPLMAESKKCLPYTETQFNSLCESLPDVSMSLSTFHMNIRSLPKN